MPGLIFQDQTPVPPSAPNRMDIALFVGFVRTAPRLVIPPELERWLDERGWTRRSDPRAADVSTLLDVPVPIQSLAQFEALFDWQHRTSDARDGAAYLGAAVRSFFAQGGRRCYVVRVGDPLPLETKITNPQPQRDLEAQLDEQCLRDRRSQIARLIPGYPQIFLPSSSERLSWSGAGHLYGLPDVSFLVMPDLAEAVAARRRRVEVPTPPPGPSEVFVECTPAPPAPTPDRTIRDIAAPVCDASGLEDWRRALVLLTGPLLRTAREISLLAGREVTLLASLPIAPDGVSLATIPSTAYLQLAYPWARSPGSVGLAAGLESPDGVLAGILARNALVRGTFRSAANLHLADVTEVYPVLDRHQQQRERLIERVSLLGPTPSGLRLLSDVTMFGGETYRPGSISRLSATITRAARHIGEDLTFQPAGEQLWSEIRGRLDSLMRGLYEVGVFRGSSAGDAYQVRCDRGTMTQNDIDNGRVIATIQFDAAAPIDTITIVLTLTDSQPLTVVRGEAA